MKDNFEHGQSYADSSYNRRSAQHPSWDEEIVRGGRSGRSWEPRNTRDSGMGPPAMGRNKSREPQAEPVRNRVMTEEIMIDRTSSWESTNSLGWGDDGEVGTRIECRSRSRSRRGDREGLGRVSSRSRLRLVYSSAGVEMDIRL
ncbi:hypothetical protein K440DRAFT_316127 [Wilcoxina mikolae CBS 423.85]|nr:hypothetical protein K440DRAFT_316127 [Wilcoxina mikolae CBS 423.85]